MKMKKKTRRSKSQFPALDKNYNLAIRHDSMDQDYIHKLNDKEKDWLNRFNEEYVNTNFEHEGKRIHPKKSKTVKVKSTGKKRTVDVYKKEAEDRNNARNRDSYAITKINKLLREEKDAVGVKESERSTNTNEVEDRLIEMLDASRDDET